jgi:hypothetical protein
MHNFVAEQCHDEGASSYDDDCSPAWYAVVDSMDKLRSNNHVHRGPAKASEDIEDRNWLCGQITFSDNEEPSYSI